MLSIMMTLNERTVCSASSVEVLIGVLDEILVDARAAMNACKGGACGCTERVRRAYVVRERLVRSLRTVAVFD